MALKELSKKKNIMILKPDKGSGVVILNKADYLSKMNDNIADEGKFVKVNTETGYTIAPKLE